MNPEEAPPVPDDPTAAIVLPFTRWTDAHHPSGRGDSVTWLQMVDALSRTPKARPYAEKREDGSWAPTRFQANYRNKTCAMESGALVLDFDNDPKYQANSITIEEALAVWDGQAAHAHTSHGSGPERLKFRLAVLLSRCITADEHARIWRWAVHRHREAGQSADLKCSHMGMHWFRGCVRPEDFRAVNQPGKPIDVGALLAELSAEETEVGELLYTTDPPQRTKRGGETNYGLRRLRQAVEVLSDAANPPSHGMLQRHGNLIGGYAAGGELDTLSALRELEVAVSGWGDVKENLRRLHDFFEHGQRRPLSAPNSANYQHAETEAGALPTDPWDAPIPLRLHEELPPPEFPTEVLTPKLRSWVLAVSHGLQTPPDLPAMLALAAVSMCLQRRFFVLVRAGWRQPVNIYTTVIARTGTLKTPSLDAALGAIRRWQKTYWEASLVDRIRAETIAEAAEAAHKRASTPERGKDLASDVASIEMRVQLSLKARVAREAVPRKMKLIAADATPEALAKLMSSQGECIGIFDDEDTVFKILIGLYRGGEADTALYLKGYSGSQIITDRISRDEVDMQCPRITMGVTVQPVVLRALTAHGELAEKGLLARIMWCWPTDNVGRRDVWAEPAPQHVLDDYDQLMTGLLDRFVAPTSARHATPIDPTVEGDYYEPDADGEGLPPQPNSVDLVFDPAADHRMRVWQAEIEPQLLEGGDLDALAGWGSKLAGQTARLAALLHVLDHPQDPGTCQISVATLERAIVIARYLIPHAQRAFGGSVSPVVLAAEQILRWARNPANPHPTFTKRDVHVGNRGFFAHANELHAPLSLLEQHGYVRLVAMPERKGAGRKPSPTYAVHPTASVKMTQKDYEEMPIETLESLLAQHEKEEESCQQTQTLN